MSNKASKSNNPPSKSRTVDTETEKKADHRTRNNESVRRFRERERAERNELEKQFSKNSERLRALEATVAQISNELHADSSQPKKTAKRSRHNDQSGQGHTQPMHGNDSLTDRPAWFGEPF